MVKRQSLGWAALMILITASTGLADPDGSIRGIVFDKDFDAPLPAAKVLIAETDQSVTATDQGNYLFEQVAPGAYTLVFSKEGYVRQVRAGVVVSAEQMTEVNASLAGEFEEMEEFVVQDVQIGAATETALLELRMESPALMDSISSEMMSRAGAGDAAAALRLVAGATVQDGKYATVRGLPDRYVNSQMNGVRLPTADADKRAVQLDQFPSAVIDSMQVSKTFTPDQQGDASGGAVNVVLKDIPDAFTFNFSTSSSWDSPSAGRDFLGYRGGGLNTWGRDKGNRNIQYASLGQNWTGAAGVDTTGEPTDYKWSIAVGNKWDFDNFRIGAFGSFFYERDSSFFENGIDDKFWVDTPGAGMTPQYGQGTPDQGDFRTSLFDVTQGSQSVQWGGLGVLGLEMEDHAFSLLYMYTRSTEDTATLAEDTRGKAFYFPGYDRNDPTTAGNQERDAAPYIRTETLEYTERSTQLLQFSARHTLPDLNISLGNLLSSLPPELDWSVSKSSAKLYQPDKRQFGSIWLAPSFNAGFPPFLPPSTLPAVYRPYKPAANFTIGNFQRTWKEITEDSDQYKVNLKIPFEQWSGDEGYLKFGLFNDRVIRSYNQDSFSNFNDNAAQYQGDWEDYWSRYFPSENHPITAGNIDVDYKGRQDITAWYYMIDMPLSSYFNIIGGARYEKTDLSIVNDPEEDVTWIPSASSGQVKLNPGDADVFFKQRDVLPSIGFVFKPLDSISFRGSYSQTVARQTFKELSPIQQQEFLGGDVFIGNPNLNMSALENYDLRFDWTPYQGGLVSVSHFKKDIIDPIEYVQRNVGFTYTTPVNYPKGKLDGWEIEFRQELARFWQSLEGVSMGANATLINSEVTLPPDEAQILKNLQVPEPKREMTNAPEHLYNFYLNYDLAPYGAQLSLFYTIRGDTLVAGAGQSSGKYIPSVYETEYGTLNFSWTQKLGEIWKLRFQAKNLLDPKIETVYRSKYIGSDVTKTSYRKGMEFSVGLSATF